jgi:hypothetical protein
MGSLVRLFRGAVVALALPSIASADLTALGYLSYSVTVPGRSAEFDITNQTGANSTPFPDITWPAITPVPFTITSLLVDFNDGSSTTYGSSYFTLGPDGLSLFGNTLDISGSNPQPTMAFLTGTIPGSLIHLNIGGLWAPIPPAVLVDSAGGTPALANSGGGCSNGGTGCLQDGDLTVLYAATQSAPEPSFGALLLVALAACAAATGIQQRL